jgi:hypothetical protein
MPCDIGHLICGLFCGLIHGISANSLIYNLLLAEQLPLPARRPYPLQGRAGSQ